MGSAETMDVAVGEYSGALLGPRGKAEVRATALLLGTACAAAS